MLVAIPEVPETSHQGSTGVSGSSQTTTAASTNNTNRHHHHHHHQQTISVKHCSLLLAPTAQQSLESSSSSSPSSPGSPRSILGSPLGGGVGLFSDLVVKREMKPPMSATIPKSRNHHRRTPPTPPAHSPSPPTLTPPPIMTSQSSTSPLSHTDPSLSTEGPSCHRGPLMQTSSYSIQPEFDVSPLGPCFHYPLIRTLNKISSSHVMEINTSYATPLVKKEVSSPPLGSPHLGSPQLPPCSTTEIHNMANDAVTADSFQQRIFQLKQEQQKQQEMLLQQYQQQQQQLAEQHEKQLQQHIMQYLEQQSQRAEEERAEKQRKEQERLEALVKGKDKHAQSAVASSEVKQRLQEVLLQKKQQREAAAGVGGSSNLRNWLTTQRSLEKNSPSSYPANAAPSSSSHPYRPPGHALKYEDDFPLRKTASEPNICLKARHKQRVSNERRPSPLVRRKDRPPGPIKRRQTYTVESGSTPDSGQSSPPNGLPASRSSSGSTPIHEEGGGSPYGALGGGGQGSCSDLTLYSSPSLPNISLGRPPHSTQPEGMKLPIVSEAEMRTPVNPHLGMALTGHVLSSNLPYYPTLPVIDGEGYSTGASSIGRQQVVTAMDTSPGGIIQGGIYPHTIIPSDAQYSEFQIRPSRTMQRPLSRTHSSPLPLGHPMLQGTPPTFLPHAPPSVHQYDAKHTMDQHMLKQHIRQTVLSRTPSKNHVENVAEETEAAVAQAIAPDKTPEEEEEEVLHEEEPEVIDLTERKMEESSIARQQRDRAMFLKHQRELLTTKPPSLHSTSGSTYPHRSGNHIARPLSRALSSPLVTLSPQGSPQEPLSMNKQGATTGFAYDNLMLKHQCICGDNSHHPEHGGRLQSIWARLQETALIHRCHRTRPRKATLEEIQSCHSEAHTLLFGTNPWNRSRLDPSKFAELPIKSFVRLHCSGVGVDSDTTWNEIHTSSAARMAAGCVIDLAFKVATGELRNGFALVRPPGHHAERQQAMGFCFFNSVAIAARQLHQKLNIEKILIIDWDVHHGNGTQSMFYDDRNILYISVHRYDDGSFFPGTGAPTEVGEGDGYGFNVNIAFSGGLNPPMGDAEYMAAFRTVVMPIAKDFDPEIILVSAGFDAAEGHPSPLGGYKVSASCFAHMTKQLMTLARGKVVLALEGGYNLTSICDATEACVRALTSDEAPPISESEMSRPPCQSAVDTLQNVIAVQSIHWPVVRRQSGAIALSALEAQGREEEQETVSAMASLKVDPQSQQSQSPEPAPKSPATETPNDEEEPMEEDTEVK
ncbi:histone deacetylase 4-like isoform X8 [Macrobrachium nipponense]|uniref:histone deacetylase 4-like isoform X8 n=1 Tax=Macrobrachium nipponense TaxID=159736 RepID=UPI0030C8087B